MEFLREKGMLMGERQPVSLWEERDPRAHHTEVWIYGTV